MGIKERHERDRETVRRAILDAARELFVVDGYQNVSLRKIAERIEYSPAAIYSYFPSKDDIFFALAEEGFALLNANHTRTIDLEALAPLDRVRAMFLGLYEFSVAHPEYFALIFVDRTVPRISKEYERFAVAHEMKARLMNEVQRLIEAGTFPKSVHPYTVFRLLMVAVVGVAVLRLSGRLAPTENADDIAADMLDVTLTGLQTGATLRSVSNDCFFHEPERDAPQAEPSSQELGS
jgi:AcrR family transcriptional regulator